MNRNAKETRVGVFVFFVACACVSGCQVDRESRIAAATAAIEHSLDMHELLSATRECPMELDDWTPDPNDAPGVLATLAGTADRQYKLSLRCTQERGEFSITIRYSFDDHVYVSGTFDGPLELIYGHFTDQKTSVVPEHPDIAQLAQLLAYGG